MQSAFLPVKCQIFYNKGKVGGCKGKIGKKGNKWLMESGATVESCQLACLEDKGCKFSSLQKKGKPSNWKCASYSKKCKVNKNKKFMVFKKNKIKASQAVEQGKIWTEDGSIVPGLSIRNLR